MGNPRKLSGHSGLLNPLADRGEQDDGQGKAQAAGEAIDQRLQEIVVLLDVQKRHAQYGAVGGDEGQVDAQGLIQGGHALFQKHLHHLHNGGNDENESSSLHVPQVQRREDIVVHCPGNHGGQGHDEGDRYAHAQGSVRLFGHTHEGADAQKLHQNEVVGENGSQGKARREVTFI